MVPVLEVGQLCKGRRNLGPLRRPLIGDSTADDAFKPYLLIRN